MTFGVLARRPANASAKEWPIKLIGRAAQRTRLSLMPLRASRSDGAIHPTAPSIPPSHSHLAVAAPPAGSARPSLASREGDHHRGNARNPVVSAMMWSRISRRQLPIHRSARPFCQGARTLGVNTQRETASQGTKYIEWSEVWICPELSTVASQTSHDEMASS